MEPQNYRNGRQDPLEHLVILQPLILQVAHLDRIAGHFAQKRSLDRQDDLLLRLVQGKRKMAQDLTNALKCASLVEIGAYAMEKAHFLPEEGARDAYLLQVASSMRGLWTAGDADRVQHDPHLYTVAHNRLLTLWLKHFPKDMPLIDGKSDSLHIPTVGIALQALGPDQYPRQFRFKVPENHVVFKVIDAGLKAHAMPSMPGLPELAEHMPALFKPLVGYFKVSNPQAEQYDLRALGAIIKKYRPLSLTQVQAEPGTLEEFLENQAGPNGF